MEFSSPRALLWGGKLFLGDKNSKKNKKNAALQQEAPTAAEDQVSCVETTQNAECRAVPPDSEPPSFSNSPPAPEDAAPNHCPKQVWATPPETPRFMQFSLKSLLTEAGMDMSKGDYVVEVLHPLLEEMVMQAVKSRPEDPAMFFLEWLFKRLAERIPAYVSDPFFEWQQDIIADLPEGPPIDQRSQSKDKQEEDLTDAVCEGEDVMDDLRRHSNVSAMDDHRRHSNVTVVDCSETVVNKERVSICSEKEEEPASPVTSLKSDDAKRNSRKSRHSLRIPGKMKNAVPKTDQPAPTPLEVATTLLPGEEALKAPRSCLKGGSRNLSRQASRSGDDGDCARRLSAGAGAAIAKFAEQVVKHAHPDDDSEDDKENLDGMDSRRPSFNNADSNWKARMHMRRRASHYTELPKVDHSKALGLVEKVPLFHCLSSEEKLKVAEALEVKCFEQDSEIVPLGAKGGDLHIIMSGEASITVPTVVSQLQCGDWFGEQSVMKPHIGSTQRIVAMNQSLITMCITCDDLVRLELKRKLQTGQKKQAVGKSVKKHVKKKKINRQGTPNAAWLGQSGALDKDLDLEKSDQDIKLIKDGVLENVHFVDVLQLSEDQVDQIANEVVSQAVPLHSEIAKEGEILDSFFIVHDGLFEVLEGDKSIRKLRNGESFGEDGLLYNSPSRHTIKALRHSIIWKLPQDNFRKILKAKSASKQHEYIEMLERVSVFSYISESDKELLVDALEEVFFVKSEEVIVPETEVDKMYFVADGILQVEGIERSVTLSKGDHFADDLLISERLAQEKVTVTTETATLLTLDKDAVEILLGITIGDLSRMKEEEAKDQSAKRSTIFETGRLARARNSLDSVGEGILSEDESEPDIPVQSKLRRIGILGAGSFGMVSLEEDKSTGKMYALKALSKGFVVQQGMKEVALQEKTVGGVFDSVFVVKQYATYCDDQYLYFIMQPAMGGELFELYQDHEEWWGNSSHARFFAACVSLGLDHIHSKKVIYRDLKMENILLDTTGYPLISDFGLAKVVLGKTYTVCGTPDYMSPEILRRTGHNRGADWWAFGVLLFIMMSGRSPFDAEEVQQIYRNVVKGFKKEHFPDRFSQPLKEVIQGLCRKKPEERLPMGPKGLMHVKSAPWFKHMDWEALVDRSTPAPFKPIVKTHEEIAAKVVEPPPIIHYEDDGTAWEAEFSSNTNLPS